ncbi:MAG: dienelactone hydrolase family protein [Thermodesulfovibrionia bacterium]
MSIDNDQQLVSIPADSINLEGILAIPQGAQGIVIFVHGSGSSRHSPRNNFVAQVLRDAGLGTFLFDLLTKEEDLIYEKRFDIPLLTSRLKAVTEWIKEQPDTRKFNIGYFGASTGSAAALMAADDLGEKIGAVVSRGGRPDLAEKSLHHVQSPTLLIIGGYDDVVIQLNQQAYKLIKVEKRLSIVQGATHLFEEPGTLEEVARLASEWFKQYLLSH